MNHTPHRTAPFSVKEQSGPRADERRHMLLQASMRAENMTRDEPIRIRNISAGGLMAVSRHVVRRGEPVTIVLVGIGELAGRIAWTQGERFGVSFSRPINPNLVRQAIAQRRTSRVILTHVASPRRPGLRSA